jgi:hypothetical protein
MNSLKRETTIPKRKPDPFSSPATVRFRLFSSLSFSVAEPARNEAEGCFCGGISSLLKIPTHPPRPNYLPLNCAARFSRNAVVPSFLSSVAQHTPNSTASR